MADTVLDKVVNIAAGRSDLEITGSGGVEFAGEAMADKTLALGFTTQTFQITDHKNNRKGWLSFKGSRVALQLAQETGRRKTK